MGSELWHRMMSTYLWEEQPLDNYEGPSNLLLDRPGYQALTQALYLSADSDVAVGRADNGDLLHPCCMKPAAPVLSSGAHLCSSVERARLETCRDDVGVGPVCNVGLAKGGV